MDVDTKTYLILIKIIDRIEMPQESITNQEEILILSWQSTFVNDKVTFIFICFIQILSWVDFKNIIAHLKAYWLDLGCYRVAPFGDVAECFVTCAVEIRKRFAPLGLDLFKYVGWNGELRASGVYDGWICCVFSWFLHWLGSIVHTLAF
jgi:hypothetical protein